MYIPVLHVYVCIVCVACMMCICLYLHVLYVLNILYETRAVVELPPCCREGGRREVGARVDGAAEP